MRQIILDTETTGLDPLRGHRITEIGCIEMVDRRPTGRQYQTYLNPEREVDPDAARITGLTTEFLKDKPKFIDVADELMSFLNQNEPEIIIHNAPFDLSFLNHELNLIKHAVRPLEKHFTIVDTLIMARQMYPGQRNSLDALCKRYNINNTHREYHGALLDSELLMSVYLALTAGQTNFALGTEAEPVYSMATVNVKVLERLKNMPLKVIYASESELQLHEIKLKLLQDQS